MASASTVDNATVKVSLFGGLLIAKANWPVDEAVFMACTCTSHTLKHLLTQLITRHTRMHALTHTHTHTHTRVRTTAHTHAHAHSRTHL